ncbi:rubredoxin-like domain-containing protein [Pelosinus sp. sgz500959]|uniref:rubredoxin-like domain-containing protein n=1 Tax=Pelosinus sp. sgz500959 TaxID=3242472 RepID=UPI00366E02F0
MKKLFKCSVCNFMHEGEGPYDTCPKCGAGSEKFVELSAEAADKVYQSERTNDIHMEIIALTDKIIKLSLEGIELNLDPNCVSILQKAVAEGYVIKQRAKAELEGHIGKGKW